MDRNDSKLDQALGEIIQQERENAPRRRNQQRHSTGVRKAPAGGIQKNRAQPHRRVVSQPDRASSWKSDRSSKPGSEIIINNLPKDVTEDMIKEYFNDRVSNVIKVIKVEINYKSDGQSRGSARVGFAKENGASVAIKELDGLLIDQRPISIEVIKTKLDPPKSIAERVAQPKKEKSQPKSAVDSKEKGQQGQQTKRTNGPKKNQPRRGARPAKKTAEELDLEMDDYFESVGSNNNNDEGVAPSSAPGGDDAAMDDEIS